MTESSPLDLDELDLDKIQADLYKRLDFSKDDEEYNTDYKEAKAKYYTELATLQDKFRNAEGNNNIFDNEKKSLDYKARSTIRKLLNDDEGFRKLYEKMDQLQKYKDEKETKLDKAKTPSPVARFGSLFSRNAKSENTAKIYALDKEIQNVNNIIDNLNTLKPIYDANIDELPTYGQTGGGKRKSRRNKKSKKSKKSKKNHRKIESSSNFIEKNIKKLFNIG